MRADGAPLRVEPGAWPHGFAAGPENRRALLVLASLRGIKPKQLLLLALRERTAARCLAAIRRGDAGSDGDQEFAREADPIAIQRAVASCGARLVVPGSEEYVVGLE